MYKKSFHTGLKLTATLLLAFTMAGCIYKLDTRQGNALDSALVSTITIGTSKIDVVARLGSPLIQNPIHTERWDYVYFQRDTDGNEQAKSLTIIFENDVVATINKDGMTLK